MDTLAALRDARLVPVVVLDDAANADALAAASASGGCTPAASLRR